MCQERNHVAIKPLPALPAPLGISESGAIDAMLRRNGLQKPRSLRDADWITMDKLFKGWSLVHFFKTL